MGTFLQHKNIEYIFGGNPSAQRFDTVYYVASEQNTHLNDYVFSQMIVLQREINDDEFIWFPARINIIPARNKMFPYKDGKAYLYCGIMPSAESQNKGCAFLSAEIEDCPTDLLYVVLRVFYRQVLKIDDEILATCHIESQQSLHDDIILPANDSDCFCIRLEDGVSPISGFRDILSTAKKLSRPSRLSVIRYPNKLILTDYDNLEIRMPAQSMALYLLLLCHPEGIMHKQMSDYKGEYEQIYLRITNRDDLPKLKQSVSGLFDLENDNALRLVKHRCNKEIERVLPKRLTKPYIIQGKSREPRRIMLDRCLLELSDLLR